MLAAAPAPSAPPTTPLPSAPSALSEALPSDPSARPAALPPAAPPLTRRGAILGTLAAGSLLAAWPRRARADGAPRPVVVARGLQHPWSVAFLPGFEREGRMLVTERPGRLRLVTAAGKIGEPVLGLPRIEAGGQGGLLDVALDPAFESNQLVYLSYTEPGDNGERGNGTAVGRGRLTGNRLTQWQVVFRQKPKFGGSAHFGSRLVFARDGRLFVTLGDRFSLRAEAQRLDSHIGKVIRIEPDGSVPADNPFVGRDGALPEIWSYGHRNVQGAALHPETGELWTHEHGPQGGDELNVTLAGRNYGWPVITYGREYGLGTRIGEGTERNDIEPAVTTWVPSIAPSGLAFVSSDRYPEWRGNAFVGALRAEALVRLELDGRKVVREERLLPRLFSRVRDVRQGPDGWLYLLTDNEDGRLIRLER